MSRNESDENVCADKDQCHSWAAVTHRINRFMLGEAHWRNTIDTYSQDSDEQMDKGDPVCKKRPRGNGEHHSSVSPTEGGKRSLVRYVEMCSTYGHPCPLSASWRSCQCACGRCGLWAFLPCPVHKVSSLWQKASWQVQRCAAHAAVR